MDPGCPPGAEPRLLPFLYLPTALLCVHPRTSSGNQEAPRARLPWQQLLFETGLCFRLAR